jgi:hypothetical protein
MSDPEAVHKNAPSPKPTTTKPQDKKPADRESILRRAMRLIPPALAAKLARKKAVS